MKKQLIAPSNQNNKHVLNNLFNCLKISLGMFYVDKNGLPDNKLCNIAISSMYLNMKFINIKMLKNLY